MSVEEKFDSAKDQVVGKVKEVEGKLTEIRYVKQGKSPRRTWQGERCRVRCERRR